ncbi:RidA family protein [Agaribacterium sp. ZY112]|uniref:RidA family protein n=1 Tax=Agaribacterium sp. ZY112 TaxID=3233574 RepID=UPI0035256144
MRHINKLLMWTSVLLLLACGGTQKDAPKIERQHYNSWEKDLGYSQVVRVGNTLYVSGMTAQGVTLESQMRAIYKSLQRVLDDYKISSASVVKEVIYTRDIEALKKANSIRLAFYSDDQYPSSSWLQVEQLFLKDFLVEIEFVLVVDG